MNYNRRDKLVENLVVIDQSRNRDEVRVLPTVHASNSAMSMVHPVPAIRSLYLEIDTQIMIIYYEWNRIKSEIQAVIYLNDYSLHYGTWLLVGI